MTAANSGFAAQQQQHQQQQDAFDSMSNVAMHHHHHHHHHPASTFPQMHHHQQSNSFYASSHASASSSSLVDQLSDHESSYSNSFEPHADGSFGAPSSSTRSGPGPSSSSQGFPCPNCGKAFARDDLLRRHLAREARALAQPSFDRQKSCYECARSKARCDLEVPTCGRCRARGKQCQYAPRSGNPNVRKARNVGVIQQNSSLDPNVHAMTPQMHPAVPPAMPPHPMHNATWPMQTPDFNMASAAFMTPNPNYANRDAEVDYDSQSESEHHSWHDPASSASGSALGSPRSQHSIASQPDSAPPNLANFSISATPAAAAAAAAATAAASYANIAPPIRTDSPHSFHDLNLDSDAAPAPPRMPARKSSGFSRTNTGPIVTNIDRANVAFANDDGEETPIVRLNHLATDTSKLHTNVNNNHFLAAPHSRHRTTSMPEAVEENMHEPWHQRSNAPQQAFNATASSRQHPHPASQHNAMMPPPRPPTLITSNLNNRSAWPNPSPIRSAVFQHGIDLSGWLAEPVVPSPLYRMGPSLHSAISGNFAAISHSPVVDTPISAKFAASLAHQMGLSTNPGFLPMFQDPNAAPPATATAAAAAATAAAGANNSHPLSRSLSDSNTPPQSRYDCDGQLVLPAPQLPSAKQWWIQPDQSGEVAASIAQASAAHFVSYPALIVLTDPTAPIPPFIHRKWLQENRASVPESLANARSILAGYYVRLPASQSLIWRLISEQIRLIVADKPRLTAANADSVPVFGAVAALWMYLVLIVFTDEPAITDHVSAELLDEALLVLSDVSQALLAHAVRACEAASQQSTPSLATFGWIETMVRTLFASYSLLVLQRFRENAGNARERLAGCSLILDLPLPAAAGEFEADKEADWMQAHTAHQNALSEAGAPFARPTLRQLVQLRNEAVAAAPEAGSDSVKDELRDLPWACTLFDHHDEFTNVVLSVAFALDDTRL